MDGNGYWAVGPVTIREPDLVRSIITDDPVPVFPESLVVVVTVPVPGVEAESLGDPLGKTGVLLENVAHQMQREASDRPKEVDVAGESLSEEDRSTRDSRDRVEYALLERGRD